MMTVVDVATVAGMEPTDPVGMIEIAALLGVVEKTVHTWRFRQILPPADYASVNGNAAWTWRTILEWAGRTGHIRDDDAGSDAVAQYRKLFGVDPAPHRKGGRIMSAPVQEAAVEKAPVKRRAEKKTPAKKKAAVRKRPMKLVK
jgi:hypothetical protein